MFPPGLKRRGGGGGGGGGGGNWTAIGLCIIHFIEGILSFDVYTWKGGGCSRKEEGCCTPLPPFGGNTARVKTLWYHCRFSPHIFLKREGSYKNRLKWRLDYLLLKKAVIFSPFFPLPLIFFLFLSPSPFLFSYFLLVHFSHLSIFASCCTYIQREGVRVFLQVYKEMDIAINLGSEFAKSLLKHPNIVVS